MEINNADINKRNLEILKEELIRAKEDDNAILIKKLEQEIIKIGEILKREDFAPEVSKSLQLYEYLKDDEFGRAIDSAIKKYEYKPDTYDIPIENYAIFRENKYELDKGIDSDFAKGIKSILEKEKEKRIVVVKASVEAVDKNDRPVYRINEKEYLKIGNDAVAFRDGKELWRSSVTREEFEREKQNYSNDEFIHRKEQILSVFVKNNIKEDYDTFFCIPEKEFEKMQKEHNFVIKAEDISRFPDECDIEVTDAAALAKMRAAYDRILSEAKKLEDKISYAKRETKTQNDTEFDVNGFVGDGPDSFAREMDSYSNRMNAIMNTIKDIQKHAEEIIKSAEHPDAEKSFNKDEARNWAIEKLREKSKKQDKKEPEKNNEEKDNDIPDFLK